jgi:hypothetical protein
MRDTVTAWANKVAQELRAGQKYADSEETATFFGCKLAEHLVYCTARKIQLTPYYERRNV